MISESIAPENIILEYGPLVSSICRKMIMDSENAKDAAQEVWMQVLKSLPSFKGNSKLSTWIYTIAKRVITNYTIKEKIYSTRFLKNTFHDTEFEVSEFEDFDKKLWVNEMCSKCLTGILHCLDNETRLAYVFKDMAQLSYQDTARILEKDEVAVRQMISRARRKLKSFLDDECALSNPEAKCRCRMRKWVEKVDLPKEFEKLKKTINRINLYRASEIIIPGKNYWESIMIN